MYERLQSCIANAAIQVVTDRSDFFGRSGALVSHTSDAVEPNGDIVSGSLVQRVKQRAAADCHEQAIKLSDSSSYLRMLPATIV